ncbi:MAG: DedA family protein [Candidatus Promineifilaceae bacterium]|nr:DedA family protein [Candidatus Promineifilaceae bacterium]
MTGWITDLVTDLGYVGLALLTFIENVFPPIPSEIIMPLGGFLVAEGELSLLGVVLAGTLGSVAGSLVFYFLGWQFRRDRLREWVGRHGRWLLLTVDDVEKAYGWFDRHGRAAVFLGRLIPGVRSLISLPAGSSAMRLGPFLLYTALGTAIWSAALAYGGMLLGDQYERLSRLLQQATYVVIALLLLVIARWIVQRVRRRQEID